MNKWQKIYMDTMWDGEIPKSKIELTKFKLLGQVKSKVIVDFPDFTRFNEFIPAHTETFVVTEDDCDMPNGKISVIVLASNLELWQSRGYVIKTTV